MQSGDILIPFLYAGYRRVMRQQTEIELVRFNTRALLDQVRRKHFRHITESVDVCYLQTESLACICQIAPGVREIWLHSVLNHPGTPKEVMRYILTHEMLHVEVRPRLLTESEWRAKRANKQIGDKEMEGLLLKESFHPPEFFEREAELSPAAVSGPVWSWIGRAFAAFLIIDHEREGLLVKPKAHRQLASWPRPTMAEAREFNQRWGAGAMRGCG